MNCENVVFSVLSVLDNASIAATLGVLMGALIAGAAYKKQKAEDRASEIKRELIGDILLLQEKVHYARFLIDRTANTWIAAVARGEKPASAPVIEEMNKLGHEINEAIPLVKIKTTSRINVYFDSVVIKEKLNNFESELKRWHDPIVEIKFDLSKRASDQPTLSLEAFDLSVKYLMREIWRGEIASS